MIRTIILVLIFAPVGLIGLYVACAVFVSLFLTPLPLGFPTFPPAPHRSTVRRPV